MPESLKLVRKCGSHIFVENWLVPNLLYYVHEPWVQDPIGFEAEQFAMRDFCFNGNHARNMVGDRFAKWFNQGFRVRISLVKGSKEPVDLLK